MNSSERSTLFVIAQAALEGPERAEFAWKKLVEICPRASVLKAAKAIIDQIPQTERANLPEISYQWFKDQDPEKQEAGRALAWALEVSRK